MSDNPMLEMPKDTIDQVSDAMEAAYKFLIELGTQPKLADQVGVAWNELCEMAQDAEATEP